ncbi:MAG: hypothetical protein P8Y15_10340, partial [Gemmatimonadales bacterium]
DQDRLRAHLSRGRSLEANPPGEGARWRDMMPAGRARTAVPPTTGSPEIGASQLAGADDVPSEGEVEKGAAPGEAAAGADRSSELAV